jgi:hypothetical protein
MAALAFAGRNGRFGDGFDRYSWGWLGGTIGLLGKTFLPVPEKGDPVSIQALPYVAIYTGLAIILGVMIWAGL